MFLALWMVLTIAVLTLPVRPVIGDDLGERDAEGLGYAFWKKRGDKGRKFYMKHEQNHICKRKAKIKALLATSKSRFFHQEHQTHRQ